MEGNGNFLWFQWRLEAHLSLGPSANIWCLTPPRCPASQIAGGRPRPPRDSGGTTTNGLRLRRVGLCGRGGGCQWGAVAAPVPVSAKSDSEPPSPRSQGTAKGPRTTPTASRGAPRRRRAQPHAACLTYLYIFYFFFPFFTDERSICKRLFLDMKNLLFNGPNCCSL